MFKFEFFYRFLSSFWWNLWIWLLCFSKVMSNFRPNNLNLKTNKTTFRNNSFQSVLRSVRAVGVCALNHTQNAFRCDAEWISFSFVQRKNWSNKTGRRTKRKRLRRCHRCNKKGPKQRNHIQSNTKFSLKNCSTAPSTPTSGRWFFSVGWTVVTLLFFAKKLNLSRLNESIWLKWKKGHAIKKMHSIEYQKFWIQI